MYKVEIRQSAIKEIRALPIDVRERVGHRIDALAKEPRQNGCEKLAGRANTYRIRVGDYRIVYEIYDARVVVIVVKVGHRREVYR